MRKRVLSLLLAICLVMGMLPPTALAAGETPSGETPPVETPTEVVLEMYAGTAADNDHIKWTATPGDAVADVFYATTDATTGRITDITSTYVDDATTPWNIKLDNTKTVAELTLNSAVIKLPLTSREYTIDGVATPVALKASGTGSLKVNVTGNTTIEAGYSTVTTFAMGGTTTITSENGSTLTVTETGTGFFYAISSASGDIVFENIDVVASGNANSKNGGAAIDVVNNMDVKGGTLTVNAPKNSTSGILVGKTLTVSDGAKVLVNKTSTGAATNWKKTLSIYGVKATTIDFRGALLEITDSASADPVENGTNNGTTYYTTSHIISGTIVTSSIDANDRLVAMCSNNANKDGAATLDLSDANIAKYRYVSFKLVCGENNHTYTDATDATCNKCGDSSRQVPKDIAVTLANTTTWNAKAGDVFYATTNADGVVTDLGKLAAEPTAWNIKLDNTKPVAELTLKNANLATPKSMGQGKKTFSATGDGALKVIVEGVNNLTAGYGQAFNTSMTNGTTIASDGTGILNIKLTDSGSFIATVIEKSDLTLDNVNVTVEACSHNQWGGGGIEVMLGNMTVKGGSLDVKGKNDSMRAIVVKQALNISDGAKVTLEHMARMLTPLAKQRYTSNGIAAASVNFTGALLEIKDTSGNWSRAFKRDNDSADMQNKLITVMPTANGIATGDSIKAVFSANADGEGAQPVTGDDALISRYIRFSYVCGGDHVYTNATDPDCNKCGTLRSVPMSLTVTFANYVKNMADKLTTWNAVAGEIYYATTNADGVLTDLGALTTEPTDWNIKLDNTKATAELTLRDAKLIKETENGVSHDNPAIKVEGNGSLKIIAEGNSTVVSGYTSTIVTRMVGGTTYTSNNNGLLNVEQRGTSCVSSIVEGVGKLTFENANVAIIQTRFAPVWEYPTINAAGDMDVIGSRLNVSIGNSSNKPGYGSSGIEVAGKLSLSNFSIVSVRHNAIGEDGFTGVSGRPNDPQYRFAVNAGSIDINDASLYIVDNSQDMFEYAVNVMPNLNENVDAFYSANLDGSDLQNLTSDNTIALNKGPAAAVEFPYVAFVYDCAGQHFYTDDADPDCGKCGFIREVPRTVTATFAYQLDGSRNGVLNYFTWEVPAGKIYYAKTNAEGVITSIGELAADPTEWNIKLDNTQPTAVLTLRNAKLIKKGQDGTVRNYNAIAVNGDGALQIVVDGDSTIESEFNSPIKTSMVGGTTYTSLNNSLLSLVQMGTSGQESVLETAGTLTFENANIFASNRRQGNIITSMISGAGDVNIKGGNIVLNALNCTVNGIYAAGNLTISDLAQVNLVHVFSSHSTSITTRYAVKAGGEITIKDATLRIKDTTGLWDKAINKMPTLVNVKAEYSTEFDGSNPQELTVTDNSAAIEFPYVGFIYDCVGANGDHVYTDDADADCNKCGFVRDVPRDVTIKLRTDGGDKNKTAADWLREATVKANEVYYIVADEKGFVTELTTTEPAEWDVMLDNRNPVAQLVFNSGAYLYKQESCGGNLMTISGDGALEIVIKGNAYIRSGANNVIITNMGKGTTYTSAGDSKLTIDQTGTGLSDVITESAGKLTFDHANLHINHNSENNQWPSAIITAAKDMKVIGGQLDLIATNYSIRGIVASGNLSLDDYAIVNIKQTSTSTKEFIGVTGRPEGQKQYRYGVNVAGEFTINDSTLSIVDNAKNMFEYSVNKMPVVSGNTKAYFSENTDGSNLQTLAPANPDANVEYPYIAFAYDCGNQHTYTDDADPVCNKCGAVRIVPYPITVTITNLVSKVLDPGKQIVWNAAIGQVYYATTDKQGVVTDLGALSTEPAEWNIKLDNTKAVAELTFKNATVKMDGAKGLAQTNSAIKVAGEGTLKIVIDGNSSIESGYKNTLITAMKGGTTYTSVNNGKLTLNQNGTSGLSALTETAGVLNFENANIRAIGRRQGKYLQTIVSGSYDVNISGGSIEIESTNCSNQGLYAGGNLKLTNWAKVRLISELTNVQDYKGGVNYGVSASGEITIDNASLRITDSIGNWNAAISKSPKLIGSTAKYSEDAKGTNLQALNPEDPTKPVEYPYVEYVVNCAEHIWDNTADPDCNRCGEIRAVPYDITVFFTFGSGVLSSVAWEAKVGEIYYATTTAGGLVVDLGAQTTEPAKWNIKLDNTGAEAVLTLREATITRTVRPGANDKVLDVGPGGQGTITAMGKGALRIVCEKASTITTGEAYYSIFTSMNGGTTFESKNNAKLTLTNGKSTATCGAINENVGSLTFDHANVSAMIKKTSTKYTNTTVSTPKDMTVIGGKVEIIGGAYATNALSVKGDLLVKENGILIVTTSSNPAAGGTCATKPYGVTVTGDITVDNATMMIKNYAGYWSHLINKMPILVGAGAYASATSTKESKLEAFTADAGTDMTQFEAKKFIYFSNAEPGTLEDSTAEEEEDDFDDSFIFDDTDNPFTGDTVNVTLLFVLIVTSAAALVVLFSKKKALRE